MFQNICKEQKCSLNLSCKFSRSFKYTEMKVSELLKILKKDGWELYRNGKRHDIYRHPTKDGQIPIPRHGSQEVAKGTEQQILKDAGLK